jgi:hypothetical protein
MPISPRRLHRARDAAETSATGGLDHIDFLVTHALDGWLAAACDAANVCIVELE